MRVDGRFYAAMVVFILLSVLLGEARRIVGLVVQVNVYVRVSKCVRVADMSKDICHKHNVILVLLFSNTGTDRAIDTHTQHTRREKFSLSFYHPHPYDTNTQPYSYTFSLTAFLSVQCPYRNKQVPIFVETKFAWKRRHVVIAVFILVAFGSYACTCWCRGCHQ